MTKAASGGTPGRATSCLNMPRSQIQMNSMVISFRSLTNERTQTKRNSNHRPILLSPIPFSLTFGPYVASSSTSTEKAVSLVDGFEKGINVSTSLLA